MLDYFRCHKYQETIAFDTDDVTPAADGTYSYAPATGMRTGTHYTVRFKNAAFTMGCAIEDVLIPE